MTTTQQPARLGPNDLAPCPSPSAVRRHLAHGEACPTCGTGYEPQPTITKGEE